MKPVTSLLVRGPESGDNPLIRDSREFLDTYRQCNACVLGRADDHYISQGSFRLAQGLQVAVLRLASLENSVAPLDPLNGGGGSQEDFLGLEAAGACVKDYPSRQISTEGRDGSSVGVYRCNWRFSASLGALWECSISGGYGMLSKVRASSWHWRSDM